MTPYQYHPHLLRKTAGFLSQPNPWLQYSPKPVQGSYRPPGASSLQPRGPHYGHFADSDSQQAAQALTSMVVSNDSIVMAGKFSYECIDPHCDPNSTVQCFTNHDAAQACGELCEGVICRESDCGFSATCEWNLGSGQGCNISLRDKQGLYQHVSRDHLQPLSMVPMRCGDQVPYDEAAQHMAQHAGEASSDPLGDVYPCLIQDCEFKCDTQKELYDHVASTHPFATSHCPWGNCHQTIPSAAELQEHVYINHLCVDPRVLLAPSGPSSSMTYQSAARSIPPQGQIALNADFTVNNEYPGLSPSTSQSPTVMSSDIDMLAGISPHMDIHSSLTPAATSAGDSFTANSMFSPESMSLDQNLCLWEYGLDDVCGAAFEDASSVQTHIESEHLSTGRRRSKTETGENAALFCKWQGCKHNEDRKPYGQAQHLKEHVVTHMKRK